MNRGNWKKPVVLEMMSGQLGSITVSDTLEAALMMLAAWPCKRTPAHMTAVMACRDVLTGRATPALARADFIEAALEAGFVVQAETFLADSSAAFALPDDLACQMYPLRQPGNVLGTKTGPSLEGALASGRPSSELDRGPAVWTQHFVSPPPADAEAPGMRELLVRLAETLGAITLILLQNAAGMLNVDIRRREPGRVVAGQPS